MSTEQNTTVVKTWVESVEKELGSAGSGIVQKEPFRINVGKLTYYQVLEITNTLQEKHKQHSFSPTLCGNDFTWTIVIHPEYYKEKDGVAGSVTYGMAYFKIG